MTKKALVTGASGGIGLAFAQALAKDGWEVTLVARSAGKLEELAKSLPGGPHRALAADLSVPADIARVAQDVSSGGFDLLVNNAGVGIYGDFALTDLEKQQAMTRLNIDAVVALAHAFLAKAKAGDALVNVSSTLGIVAMPTAALYSATKAFVLSFSETLWHQAKPRGVYVMALCPGATKTGFHEAAGGTESQRPPEGVTQTVDEVVAEAMAALAKRQGPTLVTGYQNRAMAFASRLMSRKMVVTMMGRLGAPPK